MPAVFHGKTNPRSKRTHSTPYANPRAPFHILPRRTEAEAPLTLFLGLFLFVSSKPLEEIGIEGVGLSL